MEPDSNASLYLKVLNERVQPFTTNLIDNIQWLALLTGG